MSSMLGNRAYPTTPIAGPLGKICRVHHSVPTSIAVIYIDDIVVPGSMF
jgi:hypothetical protein